MKERIDWFECSCGIWKLKERPIPVEELKPCPFCGGKAIVWKEDAVWFDITWIGCKECGVQLRKYADNRGIKTWNRRVRE